MWSSTKFLYLPTSSWFCTSLLHCVVWMGWFDHSSVFQFMLWQSILFPCSERTTAFSRLTLLQTFLLNDVFFLSFMLFLVLWNTYKSFNVLRIKWKVTGSPVFLWENSRFPIYLLLYLSFLLFYLLLWKRLHKWL
jgi:hypothetical protein